MSTELDSTSTIERPRKRADDRGHEQHSQDPVHDEEVIPKDLKKPSTAKVMGVGIVFVLMLAALFVIGWVPHHQRDKDAITDAADGAAGIPIVGTVKPKPAVSNKDVVLPGSIRPNQETNIFPRANGYLKKLNVDIGDHVKAGQILAEISGPDTDADLAQALAALEQARGSVTKATVELDLAKSTLKRFEDLKSSGAGGVTDQEIDEKRSAATEGAGALTAAKANVMVAEAAVQKATAMQSFLKIAAPFSGTITTRNYDVGALLASTNNGTAKELFRISETDPLRVMVSVPQTYATNIKTGQPAYLTVRNSPGREFEGRVSRSAGALDNVTRTLSFEVLFPNPDGALYAGMYAQVRLLVAQEQTVLMIPSSAMLFNADGLAVATVNPDKTIHFKKIIVGRDLGTEIEVTSGLLADDQVVANPGQKMVEGVEVDARPQLATTQPAKK